MSFLKKTGVLLVCLLFMLQACAFADEGTLGGAISAERSGDTIEITEHAADGVVTTTAVSAETMDNQAVLASTTSGTQAFVTRLYQVVLNRAPDGNFRDWVNALTSGTLTAAQVVDGFFNSYEYMSKGKSASAIVNDCYYAMLGRGPDPAGKAAWEDALNIGMTPSAVLNGFVQSNEFLNLAYSYGIQPGYITLTSARDKSYARTYFVYRLYVNGLGRTPDVVGQESWCQALENSCTGVDCASGFLFSDEVYNMHLTNEGFVYVLYKTILGREPSDAELTTWADVLNYSNTREHVFNGFLLSREFAAQCAQIQAPVGSALATVDNTVEWQYNIQMLNLLNDFRAAYDGGIPLVTREDLWQAAMIRAYDLPYNFSGYRPNGDFYTDLLDDMGIWWYSAYERYGGGYETPEEFCWAWFADESDLTDNMLDPWKDTVATGYCYYPGSTYGDYFSTIMLETY